jgi:signal transduction histidine kinase/ligand-binding sensor domain-containing protein
MFRHAVNAPPAVGLNRWVAKVLSQITSILLALPLCGFAEDFQVRNWHIEDGLPDSTVRCLAQTPDGYLWAGTPKGLARFDGYSFKRFDTAGDTALKDSSVMGLLTDRQGGLWIASESGVISRFIDGEFHTCYLPGKAALRKGAPTPLLASGKAWQNYSSIFAVDSASNVWARTVTGEVIRFDESGSPSRVQLAGLPRGDVRCLANDDAGRVWLTKGTTVCVFDGGQWRFSSELKISSTGKFLYPEGGVGFWTAEVYSTGAVARCLQYTAGEGWKGISEPIPTTPVHAAVSAMLRDRKGRSWLGVTWAGLYSKPQNGEWMHLQPAGPLAKSTTVCLLEDRHGNIWSGTFGEGLNEILQPSMEMELLPPEAADVHATTVCATKDGGLWIGTDKGLYLRPPGKASHAKAVEKLGEEGIYSIMEDSQTNLWVAARSGLFVRKDSDFERILSPSFSLGGFVALCEDRAGDIWAGGYTPGLIHLRNSASGVIPEQIAGSRSVDICGMAQDGQGQVWVASMLGGLWRVEGKQLVRAGFQFDAAISNPRALLCDHNGVLWIGSYGGGLFSWKDQMLQRYTTDDGLPDNVILGLMEDDLGNLWMSSHNGITGCSKRQLLAYKHGQGAPLLCRHLGPDEGLANREGTGAGQPVMTRDPDGKFWVANMVGAAGFAPASLARSESGPEVCLDGLSVDGHLLPLNARGFRVPANSRHFEFQYSAPELAAPKTLRFRYRLDGLDRNWVDAGHERLASYSQLLPGEYHFRVMVGGQDGLWHEAKSPVILHVMPRVWQTWWFRSSIVVTTVAVLMAGAAFYERRKARLRIERMEAQQAMEHMRQRIARDLHDDLGSRITEIIQMGDLMPEGGEEPERLQPGVRTMTDRLRQLGITLDEIVWTMSSRNDTLPNLVGHISNHAQEFFRHSGIRCRLDVTKNLPNVVVNSEARHNLFLAVKEALNNVAKHSGANEVLVRVHYVGTVLRVSIEDNGRGFNGVADRNGHGLPNMQERLQAVNGRAEFLNHSGNGAKVVFTLRAEKRPQ